MSAPATESPLARLATLRKGYRSRAVWSEALADLRASDTGKAAGLALAMIANNIIALGSTVVFARELDDYGSLGALISYLLILLVAGQAMQVATAREGVLGHLGVGDALLATVRTWMRSLLILTVVLTVGSFLLMHPIASAVGVKKYPWAAALGIPAGCMYLGLSLLRGALQGVGDYRSVGLSLIGEQAARLICGATLAIGLSVTGAYLGSLLSYVAMIIYCWDKLRRHVALHPEPPTAEETRAALSLWRHVRNAWAPIAGLIVIAVLQNIDIIAAKHRFSTHTASSYAAVAVAAKVLIWVAIGAGFYLVPEVSRRKAAGEDTRGVLIKALGIILVCAIPCLLIFAVGSHQLISGVFGPKKATASDSLLFLGIAFTVLAATYLAIQYMLALKHTWFLVILALVAIAEPIALLNASHKPASFAATVLAVQLVAALLAFGFAFRRDKTPSPPKAPPRDGVEAEVPVQIAG
jgi:O-antigen/teichoic acid export membrane protein